MLYFTHRFSGVMALKGVYNGRFSFIAGVLKEELEAVFERIVRGGETGGGDDDVAVAAVREEFEHKKLYNFCLTGLLLNGLRWVARVFWSVLKGRRMAEYYYEMRTLFFAVMYPVHESMVDPACTLTLKEKRKVIRRADWVVLRLWFRRPLTWALVPVAWVIWGIGRLFAGSFTIIHVHYVDGRLVERNYAEKGIVNQVGNVGEVDHLWIARFIAKLRIEKLFRVKDQRDWEWMLMKFGVEGRIWQTALDEQKLAIRKIGLTDIKYTDWTKFEDYLQKILSFVSEWVTIDSAVQIAVITQAILKGTGTHSVPRPTGKRWKSPEYKKFVNYFYLHGN